MIRSRKLVAATAILLAAPLVVAACGDDDESSSTTTTTEASGGAASSGSSAGTSSTDTPDDGEGALDGAKTFEMTTGDGSFSLTGTASSCDNPTETTLQVTFSDGSTEVTVDATDGSGTVVAAGEFEGTIESVSVGDAGDVSVTGTGGLADPGASTTSFEITGSCA